MTTQDPFNDYLSEMKARENRARYILNYYYEEWRKSMSEGREGVLYIGRKEYIALATARLYVTLDDNAKTINGMPFVRVVDDSYLRYA